MQRLQHHHCDGQGVIGLGRQQRAVPALRVLCEYVSRRTGRDQAATSAYCLAHRRGSLRIATRGSEHGNEVERTGPARQARAWPRHEWHRAPWLEHGPEQSRIGAGRDDSSGWIVAFKLGNAVGSGACLGPHSARLPRPACAAEHHWQRAHRHRRVGRRRTVQAWISRRTQRIEPDRLSNQSSAPARRASSTSITGMSSRTG